MERPLEIRCPECEAWRDAVGIDVDAWCCDKCGAELGELVEMRGGRLDKLKFALKLEPAGAG